MKRAVITFLGTISHTKVDEYIKNNEIKKRYIPMKKEDMAKYYFDESLQHISNIKDNYVNTLPLLMDIFKNDTIIPIATLKSLKIQKDVMRYLQKDEKIFDNAVIIDERRYDLIFREIAKILDDKRYDKLIIDLTHGFRHLPILAIVNIIIQSIKDLDRIEHIFFAKEIEPYKEYKIIDLIEYIDLANMAYVLANFKHNYTVANSIVFNKENYQELVDSLRVLSTYILSNSLKQLFGKDNLLDKTIARLRELNQNEQIKTFQHSIDNIIEHLKEIKSISNLEKDKQLFEMAKLMKDRDYLLNSITLLNESIGFFCVKFLSSLDEKIAKHIEEYPKKDEYELSHQSKGIIKSKSNFNGVYLYIPSKQKLTSGQKKSLQKKKKKLKEKIPEKIIEEIENCGFRLELKKDENNPYSIKKLIIEKLTQIDMTSLEDLIVETEKIRNNLAHGNSSGKIEKIKIEITQLIYKYNKIEKNLK